MRVQTPHHQLQRGTIQILRQTLLRRHAKRRVQTIHVCLFHLIQCGPPPEEPTKDEQHPTGG